jgi:phage baseplate assembly protein W
MEYTTPALDPTDPTGTDLALDVNGDLILTTQGDVQLSTSSDNIKQMIGTRLQTIPDTYIFGDDLGSELGSMIDEPLTPANIALIQQYIVNALSVDPRIIQINNIDVYNPDDGSGYFYVTLNLTVVDSAPTISNSNASNTSGVSNITLTYAFISPFQVIPV